MYCPKCGKKLPKNATLCATCDQDKIAEYLASQKENEVEEEQPIVDQSPTPDTNEEIKDEVKTEEVAETVEQPDAENVTTEEQKEVVEQPIVEETKKDEPIKEILPEKPKKKRSFKWVKYLVLLLVLIGIGIGSYFAYSKIIGFEKLSWNENYQDYNLTFVTPNKLELGFNLSDESKINKVKIKTTCGKYEQKDDVISWDLTEASGECKIEVKYKQKKISKKIKVIDSYEEKKDLSIKYEINLDSDEDLDYDGLTNKEEKKHKTNPELADTDMDGLDDYYEINTSKTDPTKADTDGDGLNDYDEIELDLNPLKADSKGDGVKDGKRELTYEYETEGIKLSITGTGNIASVVADKNANTRISGKKGIIDNLYTFYSDGKVKEATVTLSYTDEELTKYGLTEDNLSIYYYNEKEAKYEKIDSTVNKENNTITAVLKHFSPYVIADSNLINETTHSQVLFVLDNSWSMYTNEQYKEITGEDYYGGWFDSNVLAGNDADGVRFTLTSELANKLLAKDNKVGLAEFRDDYATILPIGSSKKDIDSKLKKMNGNFVTTKAGTNTSNALVKGMAEFKDDGNEKYIIILTDGQDTKTSYKESEVISKAIENNVKICAIGFGEGVNNARLANIANSTGCKFYSSSDAMGLSELFNNVEVELNDGLVDIDDDGENDGILIADSGFIVNRDGFSFANYGSNFIDGHCFGMAYFAEYYYKKVLPEKGDAKSIKKQKSYAYNLTYTYFHNYKNNLYDFKLKSNALKYTFGFSLFGEVLPKSYLVYDKDSNNMVFDKNMRNEIDNSRLYDITLYDSTLNKKQQKAKYGVTYKQAEKVTLNEDKMQSSSNITNDEKQLFNAIYSFFIQQDVTTFYTSSSNFLLWARNVVGTETTETVGKNAFINILTTRLKDQDAPVISAKFDNGLHSINAISLVQDVDNSNIYYIGVYDNNYPGEKRYVTLECKKDTCATKANKYYTSDGQPVRITPSLEYDLALLK